MKTLDAKKEIYWSTCRTDQVPDGLMAYSDPALIGNRNGSPCYLMKTDFFPPDPCLVLATKSDVTLYFQFGE